MRETPPLAHIDLLYRSHEEIRALQNQRFRHQVALCFRTTAALFKLINKGVKQEKSGIFFFLM